MADTDPDSAYRPPFSGHTAMSPRRLLSPLMFRILAVNAMALVTLVGGVLYLNDFRDNLVAQRSQTLQIQAEIIAGALGESSISGPDGTELDLAVARQILIRLVGPTDNRARLFSTSGVLVADSRFLAGDKKIVSKKTCQNRCRTSRIWTGQKCGFTIFWGLFPEGLICRIILTGRACAPLI